MEPEAAPKENARYVQTVQGLMASGQVVPWRKIPETSLQAPGQLP